MPAYLGGKKALILLLKSQNYERKSKVGKVEKSPIPDKD